MVHRTHELMSTLQLHTSDAPGACDDDQQDTRSLWITVMQHTCIPCQSAFVLTATTSMFSGTGWCCANFTISASWRMCRKMPHCWQVLASYLAGQTRANARMGYCELEQLLLHTKSTWLQQLTNLRRCAAVWCRLRCRPIGVSICWDWYQTLLGLAACTQHKPLCINVHTVITHSTHAPP